MNIRTGDAVVVITGKDKGKVGTVLRVLPSRHRVVVSGISIRTKHIKATPQRAGQRVQYEGSIHMSNVMLVDPKTKKRTRVGYSVDEKGHKKRISKRSKEAFAAAAPTEKAVVKKAASAPSAEAVRNPGKQPFWKRIGFGAEADPDLQGPIRSQDDHTIPRDAQLQSNRAGQRGE